MNMSEMVLNIMTKYFWMALKGVAIDNIGCAQLKFLCSLFSKPLPQLIFSPI